MHRGLASAAPTLVGMLSLQVLDQRHDGKKTKQRQNKCTNLSRADGCNLFNNFRLSRVGGCDSGKRCALGVCCMSLGIWCSGAWFGAWCGAGGPLQRLVNESVVVGACGDRAR